MGNHPLFAENDLEGNDLSGQGSEGEKGAMPLSGEKPDAKVKELESRVAELAQQSEQQRQFLAAALQQQQQQRQRQTQHSEEETPDDFWQNPKGKIEAIANQASQRMAMQMQMQNFEKDRDWARSRVRQNNADLFDRWAGEIDQHVASNYAPQFHTNPAVWDTAFGYIRGRHTDELVAEGLKAKASSNDGPAAPSFARGATRGGSGGNMKLTDEEHQMARNLGLSPEQYNKGRELYEKQLGPQGSSMQEDALNSSWAAGFTFDSDSQRRKRSAA